MRFDERRTWGFMREGEFIVAMQPGGSSMTAACCFFRWAGLTDVFRAAMEHTFASRSLASDNDNGPNTPQCGMAERINPGDNVRRIGTTMITYTTSEWDCSQRPNGRLNATASSTPRITCMLLIRGSGRNRDTKGFFRT